MVDSCWLKSRDCVFNPREVGRYASVYPSKSTASITPTCNADQTVTYQNWTAAVALQLHKKNRMWSNLSLNDRLIYFSLNYLASVVLFNCWWPFIGTYLSGQIVFAVIFDFTGGCKSNVKCRVQQIIWWWSSFD